MWMTSEVAVGPTGQTSLFSSPCYLATSLSPLSLFRSQYCTTNAKLISLSWYCWSSPSSLLLFLLIFSTHASVFSASVTTPLLQARPPLMGCFHYLHLATSTSYESESIGGTVEIFLLQACMNIQRSCGTFDLIHPPMWITVTWVSPAVCCGLLFLVLLEHRLNSSLNDASPWYVVHICGQLTPEFRFEGGCTSDLVGCVDVIVIPDYEVCIGRLAASSEDRPETAYPPTPC